MNFMYHKSLDTLHVGCERPHAYFIPYADETSAARARRAESDRFISLCGEWSFSHFASEKELPDFTADGYTPVGADRLNVPMSWQYALGRGYDIPQYTNINYPYPVDPPHVPAENPCGLYERTFEMDEKTISEKKIYMTFEGVDSCFYLYINHKFAAYSQVSHMTSEILINDYLTPGVNTVQVLVFKWCDGSYLEDQDKIRSSGIIREVYLLLRDPVHIEDIYVRSEVSDDFSHACVSLELTANAKIDVSYHLVSPFGEGIASGTIAIDGEGSTSFSIDAPVLWNDEAPKLYELYLCCGTETILQRVGLRRYEIRGRVIYINGKKVKAKGVNRHDSHPSLGSATPMEHMLRDLYLLKEHNVNMIRTSHYPNDPRFLELCDLLGFYVCDETDIETHGMSSASDWDRKGWDQLTDSPEWSEAYLDRARLMMERDKNRTCVIFWSVGNESGIGLNHRLMSEYFHTRMPGCIVHSEDATRRAQERFDDASEKEQKKLSLDVDYIDVDSRMYPTPEEIVRLYEKNPTVKKPLYMCEYSHAMGNGPGDLEEYWQLTEKYDWFFGGCVWEMTDHSVDVGVPGSPNFIYGGDMGSYPNDGNFCVDGLLYPDRRPHTGFTEFKQVMRPCRMVAFDPEQGSVTLESKRFFTDLSDLDLYWTVERNGHVIKSGRIAELKIAPGRRRTYSLGTGKLSEIDGYVYLNLSFRTNTPHPWADAGYEVGSEQAQIKCQAMPCAAKALVRTTFALSESANAFTVTDGETVTTIDRTMGLITSLIGEGKEFLSSPVSPSVWRAPIDNDMWVRAKWEAARFHKASSECYSCTVGDVSEDEITVLSTLSLGAVSERPIAKMQVLYRFTRGMGVSIESDVALSIGDKYLPRFGWSYHMPFDCEQLSYFGRGPVESYEDKRHASHVSTYKTTVTDHFEHYVRPQENMAHIETRWLEVGNLSGHALFAAASDHTETISFNCSHYTPDLLAETKHDYELIPLADTVVHLDYRMSGVGSNSCGPELAKQYRLDESSFRFAVRLLPVCTADVDPFTLCNQ